MVFFLNKKNEVSSNKHEKSPNLNGSVRSFRHAIQNVMDDDLPDELLQTYPISKDLYKRNGAGGL
ncbi:hypothetical protein MWU65_08755 [Cellulophaga sp. F20128]|uniref:hypothetical protein n=1 Tax=Cellulophaga sp. F20128 TaxID=2926413 RepID=UPI001FF2EC37|nr:hypothetical protein [Cellulophaga sp. F20128]MCK0157263.1 hypothetical protein [Cellulophaga sp. F20128]